MTTTSICIGHNVTWYLSRFYSAFLLIILSFHSASSQNDNSKAFHQQLAFSCDNNFFLFNGEDGYYTNGLFLRYDRIATKQKSPASKKVFSYEIGQRIYNAHTRKILRNANSLFPGGIEEIDRPISGYLFGKVTRSTFYHDHRMLTLGLSVGTIGENSYGQAVQEFWHRMIGVKDYWNWIWDYQTGNEWGMNLHGTFANSLVNHEKYPYIQFTPITQATLGTSFTNLSQSFLLQIGKLRPMSSSAFWNSRLQMTNTPSDNQLIEFFFFYRPEIKYQFYNATIQGGMFTSNKGPILSEVMPLVITHEVGVRFSLPRFSLGYQIVFQSKEAASQFYNQSYGSMVVSFCF